MSSQMLYFEWIYLHIMYTHCTITYYYHYLPVQMYTDTVHTCLYCTHLFAVRTFLLDFTLDTIRITNFEHFSTFKEGVLRFSKSKEMCSQFGWDTASGISREQFEDLVGDWWVGRVFTRAFCRQIFNTFH